jgi:hypothetical protein
MDCENHWRKLRANFGSPWRHNDSENHWRFFAVVQDDTWPWNPLEGMSRPFVTVVQDGTWTVKTTGRFFAVHHDDTKTATMKRKRLLMQSNTLTYMQHVQVCEWWNAHINDNKRTQMNVMSVCVHLISSRVQVKCYTFVALHSWSFGDAGGCFDHDQVQSPKSTLTTLTPLMVCQRNKPIKMVELTGIWPSQSLVWHC